MIPRPSPQVPRASESKEATSAASVPTSGPTTVTVPSPARVSAPKDAHRGVKHLDCVEI